MRIDRLARNIEVEKIYRYHAENHWIGCVNNAGSFGYHDVQKGYDAVIKEQMENCLDNIGKVIIAREYDNGLVNYIHDYSFTDPEKREVIGSLCSLVYYNGNFLDSTDWDVLQVDELINELLSLDLDKKSGRPNRPTDESIIKTYDVIRLIQNNINVDDACTKTQIAKSTYYRVRRYLEKNLTSFNMRRMIDLEL